MYFDIALLLAMLVIPCVLTLPNSDWNEIWDGMLENDVSPGTYHGLKNLTLRSKNNTYKFDYTTMDTFYRRYSVKMEKFPYSYYSPWSHVKRRVNRYPLMILCRTEHMLYRAAFFEIRKYFPVRALYIDNLEFEVGYVVYQIIHRYQMMVELYEVANRKYFTRQTERLAPAKYMLYIYRSMLVLCLDIVHMCNMVHEMENKYVGHDSIFTHTEPPPKEHVSGGKKKKKKHALDEDDGNAFANSLRIIDRIAEMEKARKKAQKKERKRQLLEGMVKYVPRLEPRRPKRKRPRNHIYGWSIEDWWM